MNSIKFGFSIALLMLMLGSNSLQAQENDFRSVTDGNWSDVANWQRHNGTGWEAATYYPGNGVTVNVTIANAITANVALLLPGNLTVSGMLTVTTLNFSVGGTTSISGSFVDNSNTGVTTFSGAVSLTGTATWTSTSVTTAGNMVFQGGIEQGSSANFSAGAATFNTNAQSISIANGTGNVSFSGAAVVNSNLTLTNSGDGTGVGSLSFNGTVTIADNTSITNQRYTLVAGTLDGIGTDAEWINDADATLEYNAAAAPMSTGDLNAIAIGNTVFYNRNGDQTLKVSDYFHLNTGTNGVETNRNKTFEGIAGTFTIGGNMFIGNRSVFYLGTGAKDIAVNGNITIETSNTWFRTQNSNVAHSLTVAGVIVNNGGEFRLRYDNNNMYCDLTMTGDGDLIQGSGTGIFRLRNLTLTGAGAKTISYDGTIDFYGGQGTNAFTNNIGSFTATDGTIRFAEATTFEVNGTGDITFNNLSSGISNAAHIVILNRNITVNGLFYIQSNGSGYLDINGYTLNIYGDFNRQNTGQFRGSSTSVLNLGNENSPIITNSVLFNAAATELVTLNHNVTNGFTLGSALSVDNLNITSGTLTTGQNLTIRETFSNQGTYSQTANITYFDRTGQTISIDGDGTHTFWNMEIVDATTVTTTKSINIQGNLVNSSNAATSFNQTAGTTYFNRNAAQSIGGAGSGTITFNNLVVSDGNTKTLQGNFTVNGDFTIATGTSFNPNTFNFTVSGNTTIAGTFADANIAGTTNLQDVDLSGGAINGGANGVVNILGNLTMPTGDATIGRTELTITGTTTVPDGRTLNLTSNNGAKVFVGKVTVEGLGGNWVNSGNVAPEFRNGLEFNGTTFTSGTGAYSFTTNSQSIEGSSAMTFSGAVTVGGGVNLTNSNSEATTGVTINGVLNGLDGSSTFTNQGMLNYNSATVPMAIGTLNATFNSNTFNYTLGGNQNVAGTSYYNLGFATSNNKTLQGEVTVANTLTLADAANLSCGTYNLTLNGSVSYTSSGNLTTGTNIVTYGRNGNQDIINATYSGQLVVTGSGTKSLMNNTTVTGAVSVNGGTLNLNSNTLTTSNAISIASGATLDVNDNAQLLIANGQTLTNSGILRVVGTAGKEATVSRNVAGTFSIVQPTAGAVFHAQHYQFEYLNDGIIISDGSIDATNNFSNGSFANCTGAQVLNITGIDVSGLGNVVNTEFNTGTTYNVTRTSGTGTITFEDASGALAGENFDNDNGNPGTLIDWVYPSSTYYSTGNVSAGLLASWNSNPGGGGSNPASITDGLATLIVQDGHTVTLDNNGDIDVLALQVGQGASGILRIGQDATQRTLTVREKFEVKAGASVTVLSAGSPSHTVVMDGNLINNGIFNLKTTSSNVANIEFNGGSSLIAGSSTPIFNTVTFKSGSNVTAEVSLDINNNVAIENNAVFNDGGQTHYVYGKWTTNGTAQLTGSGTIVFDGLVNVIEDGSAASFTFNNVIFNGGGVVSIQENLIFTGDFEMDNNTICNIANQSITIGGDFTINSGSQYSHSANTTTFNGTDIQTLNFSGDVSFYNLTYSNGGANAKTVSGDITANNRVTISSGATVTGGGIHTIAGGLLIDGICNLSGTINLTGNSLLTNNASNTINLGTAVLNIEGNVSLTYGGAATALQVNVFNNLNINSGYLVLNNNTTLVGDPANEFNLNAGRVLYVRGADNFPTGFGTYNLDVSSRVEYDAAFDQTIRGGVTYGNLTVEIAGLKTVDGSLDVDGYLDLNNAITLDLLNYSHTFAGYIYNNTGSTINGANANVTIDAADAPQIVEAGTYSFSNLAITLDAGSSSTTKTFNTGSTISINGDFTISNALGSPSLYLIVNFNDNGIGGTPNDFNLGSYCQFNTTHPTIGISAFNNFTGSISLHPTSNFYYSRNGAQDITSGFTYGNLWFNGGNKTAEGNLDIDGDLRREAGTPVLYDADNTIYLAGNWLLNAAAYYTQASATGTVVFDGNDQEIQGVNFNSMVVNNAGTLTSQSNLTVYGNLTVENGAKFDANIRNIAFGGNWTVNGTGLFTQSTGTTTFNGAANQTITSNADSYFGLLTVNKPNAVGNQTVSVLSELHVNGRLNITENAGVLDISNQNVYLGGYFYVYNNTVEAGSPFISTNSTVYFNGVDAQMIYNADETELTFHNIVLSGAGDKTFARAGTAASSVDVNGDFTILGSTVSGNGWGGGTTFVDFRVAGDWVNNGSFVHGNTATVTFDGANQSIGSSAFGNVVFSGTDTKTLAGNLNLGASLTIEDHVTLNANNYNIMLAGTWTNNAANSTFVPGTGTVTFEGNTADIFAGTGAGKSFYNLVANKNVGQTTDMETNLVVTNNLTISSGNLRTQTFNLSVGGDFVVSGGVLQHNNNASRITLNASSGTKLFDPGASGTTFRGVTIDAPGATYNVQNDFTISQNQDFIIEDGYFSLNGNKMTVTTNNQRVVINGGTFEVDEGATVSFSNNTQQVLNQGGTLRLVGTLASNALLTRTGGNYTINQTSGTLHASYYKIDRANGFTISGGTIDGTNNLNHGTFSNGSGNAYLTLTGLDFADFSTQNVFFGSGPTYNVSRTSGSGTITLEDSFGALAGEIYDEDEGDPGTLIEWTFPTGFFWDGDKDDNWHEQLNWSGNAVPDGSNLVILNHDYVAGNYTVRITSQDAEVNRLILDDQATGNGIELVLENGYDLTVNENFQIGDNTTVTQTDNTNAISIGQTFVNDGTLNNGSSTVTFNGPAGSFTISTGTGAGKSFHNFVIDANEGTTYNLTDPLDVDNDFTITKGTLNLSSSANSLRVGGDWTIDLVSGGVFTHANATVTLDGTDQNISGGTFYNLTTSNSGTKQLQTNIGVEQSLTIGALTTLDAQEYTMYVSRNWTNNGNFTQTGLGQVVFDGTAAQLIDNGTTATDFNSISFSNGGAKTFSSNSNVNGDFTINNGSGFVDVDTYTITGVGGDNSFTNNGTLYIRGVNNFPSGFENIEMAANSWVDYRGVIDQTVYSTTYGNLRLRSTPATTTKTAAGDLVILGQIDLDDDALTALDMAANDANITIAGNITVVTDAINWGTGNSTLIHNGADWNIDAQLETFNNLVLSGTGSKWMFGNLTVTGNVTVKNGVYLRMYTNNNRANSRTMTGDPGKTFTLENGGRVYCAIDEGTGSAIPFNFGMYNLGTNSSYYLFSPDGVNQTLSSAITYGNLYMNGVKNVTSDGSGPLNVKGEFDINNSTYYDNSQNINIGGAYAYFTNYTPSAPTVVVNLNGTVNQRISDDVNNVVEIGSLISSGSATKTLGDGNDAITIQGDVTINSATAVTSARNISFAGSTFTNNGTFTHTANTFTFNGSGNQNVNPGASHSFNNVNFDNANTVTFNTNGADINGTFTISQGIVDLGALSHTIAGTITNTAGGTLTSNLATINLDGGNQNVNTPAFSVDNITISGTGTKRLFSNWTVGGDLTINSGTILNTSDNVGPTYYNISLGGNWNNSGTFTDNTSTVTFDGSSTPITIASNESEFYDVVLGPSAPVSYDLTSTSTRFANSLSIGADATLNLNSNTLILGRNVAGGKTFTVNGTLNVNENAYLLFDNRGSQSVLNVNGTLRVVGSSSSEVATISRSIAGVAGSETQINILSGGTLEAQYYLIEYLQDAGLLMASGSTLHSTNNLSNGTWSNIRNAANVRYIDMECNYAGGVISNITFNYTGTPTQGTHFNVRRETATPDIVFDNVAGNLGSYLYEDDDEATPSASSGKLQWPAITVTNWTGALNSDWHTAGNWDNGIPDETIDAVISNQSNDPYISNSNAACKNLIITDGLLVIENDRNLNAHGDIEIGTGTNVGILAMASSNSVLTCGGYWTRGTNGIFSHGGATVIFNSGAGSATILPRTSDFNNVVFDNPATTFYISEATINFKGDFEIVEGIVSPTTNNYTYNFEGDFSNTGGIFNQTAGSVTAGTAVFNGSGNQSITNGTFHNLTVSGSGTKTTNGPTTIDNITIVNSTLEANSGSNIEFKGNVTINTGGGFIDGGETHTFTGVNWTGDGSFTGTGTIVFNRTAGNQNIYGGKFYNLNIECIGRNLYLYDDVSIGNNLSIISGVNNIYLDTYQISNTSGIGTFSMESSVYLWVGGANNFPTGFANCYLGETTRVYYNASVDQQIAPITYGHLYLYNANTKSLTGDIVVNGGLYFYNNTTLDVTENNYSIEVKGVWSNNDGASTFLCRKGQVEFSGTNANQNIYINVLASNEFYDVLVTNQGYNVVANSNVVYTIKNNLHVTSGNFNGNGRNIYIGGDMLASGTGSFSANSTYHLNSTGSGTHLLGTNSTTILNLNINSSGGATYVAQDNISLNGDFNLTAGTFDGNGKTITLGNGNTDIITIAGTYKLGEGGRLAIGNGTTLTVEASGSIEVVGTPLSIATVTRNASGGRYNFTVNGSIAAQYYLFEYMSSSGIYLSETSTIHATNNFSNGTFTNGANTGQLLRIENTQSFTDASRINNVSFPVNPGGSSNNVAKSTAVSGNLEFYNATGAFSGATFELDPSNLIDWTGPVTLTWNGSVSTNWNDAANWTASFGPSIVPTGAEDVIIASAVNQPIITTSVGAFTANLTINIGAILILNTPADAGAVDLDINGDLIIAGTLRLNTAGDYITVEGNYSRTGTVIMNGNVTFDGAGSSKTINNGNTPFYNLTIGGTSNYQLATNATINNNLVINSGSFFDVTTANYSLTVKGNWTNAGTFSSQTGKVTFNAFSGTKTITGGTSAFNDIDINASGLTYQLGGDMSVKRNLNLIAGTLELNGNNLNMGDGIGIDYLTITGRLNVNENESLRMGANAAVNVNSGGRIDIVGVDADNVAKVTRQSTGYYGFNVNSSGTISAKHYLFEYMNSDGIYIQSGAEVGAAEDFSDGTFQNGFPTGTYLKLEKDYGSIEYIRNVVFNSGAQYNVIRTLGDYEVFFIDASGPMGSYLFELDDEGTPDAGSGLLRWSYVNTNVWAGTLSADWHTPGNWSNNEVPDLTKNAIIPNVTNDPVISYSAALAKRISLEAGATLGISGQNLTVAEEMYYEGTITVTGSPIITVGDNWTSSTGTFNAGNSTVILNAASGTRDINMGSHSFYNLEINTGGSYRLNENLTITNNLTIAGGTLNSSGYDMNVGGSWANSGTFTQGTRTVTFNGASGTHNIDNGGGNLYNLTINSGNGTGTATYRLANNLTITNNLVLSKGTFDLSSDGGSTSHNITVGNRISNSGATMLGRAAQIRVGENWIITGTGAFNCGTSEVVLTSNAGTRTVNPGTSNFYNLTTSGIAIYRLSRNTIVENNLNIQNGTLDVSSSPSYNLTVGGNWTNSSIFNERVGTVTFNGGEQIIDNAPGETFYSLTINNTSLTQTTGSVNITNTLNMTGGNILTGLNSITLGTSTANIGTLSYTAGNIVGSFERWVNSTGTDYIFPVGTSTSHNRATLRFMNGLTSGSLLVAFIPNDPGTNGLPLDDGGYVMDNVFTDGHWDITAKNSLASTDYNITLNATGFTSFTIGGDTRVIKRTNGGAWELDGTHLAAANPLCYRTDLNGISTLGTQFGLGLQNCFGGAIDIVESTICAGDDLEIFTNTTSPSGGSGYTYTWQYTTTLTAVPGDANWTDIPSSNGEIYDHGTLSESRLFVRRAVATTGCVGAQYSNAIEITVNPKPVTGAIYHIPNNFGY